MEPVIRITTKCTQKCSHCCYECSPKRNDMMSITTAKQVKKFLQNNGIKNIEIMGGEFYCHPQWKRIFEILVPGLSTVRLVTNGDWAHDKSVPEFLKQFENLVLGISKDEWHTNKNVRKAAAACKKHGILHRVATKEETTPESVVPVGRGELLFGFYSMFGCYCKKPDTCVTFLIDEKGAIFHCPFGVWDEGNVKDFDSDFAEFHDDWRKRFNSVFVANCRVCVEAYRMQVAREKEPCHVSD